MTYQTAQYRHADTKRPDGVEIEWRMTKSEDSDTSPDDFDCYSDEDKAGYNKGEWSFIGIQAEATITVTRNSTATFYTLSSAGIWGVDDRGDDHSRSYHKELYDEQRAELIEDLKEMAEHFAGLESM